MYSGNRADYTIHDNQDGTFVITDDRPGTPDGTDTLDSVEFLQFVDQTVDIATAVTAVSPIAFDFSGDGQINVTGETTAQDKSDVSDIGSTVEFDMNGDGLLETIEWIDGTGDALLVDNRDGLAVTDMNGSRLFGDQGGQFDHGYQQLAQLDKNLDGSISGDESIGLNLWIDDGDAKVSEDELFTLEELGVSEINLELKDNAVDASGRDLFRSDATLKDGSKILTEDVWFANQQLEQDDRLNKPDLLESTTPLEDHPN